jgi:hypothetical protein
MTEAANRKLPMVFITDDTKEDWYQEFKGHTLGARRELREEMTREAGVPLLMMTTETFLRHAKTHLDAKVSEETVDQAKELPTRFGDFIVLTANLTNNMIDRSLELVRAGDADTKELMLTIVVLAKALGDSEAMDRIMQAITEGQASGKLTMAQAVDAMEVVADYVRQQESQNKPPAEAVRMVPHAPE